MAVVIYRRVSTNKQGLGMAAQLERLRAEAERRDWAEAVEVTDEGISGSTPTPGRSSSLRRRC